MFLGKFKKYINWILYPGILLFVLTVLLFFVSKRAFVLSAAVLIIYAVSAFLIYRHLNSKLMKDLVEFALSYGRAQKGLLEDFVLPCAILDPSGNVVWMNARFAKCASAEPDYSKSIIGLFPEITPDDIPGVVDKTECEFMINDKYYRAAMQRIDFTELSGPQNVIDTTVNDYLIACYLFNETELHQLADVNEGLKVAVGFVSIDNYEEAMESIEEVRRSLLLALIDRKVNQCFKEYDGIVKKYEKDKYIVAIRLSALKALQKARFPLLEDVKSVNIGNEMNVTISMGFAYNQGSFNNATEAALVAMDLALGRGGDQVVLKDGEKTTFYGGKSAAVEKSTRVKARVKAQALREFIMSREKVIAMGHKSTDVDTLGAAIGIYRAASAIGKPAFIVVDEKSENTYGMIDRIRETNGFDHDMFISREKAKEIVTPGSVVVVVDTNRPGYTECPELLTMADTIVVLDHHRQSEDSIKGASLSYVEPYASSACEMVAEVLQYFDEKIRLTPAEADCMYAGLMVDTNNFTIRTGVRTFETAAFLRRNGADVTRVRKMFRDSLDDYRTRARAITNAELFMGAYAISICPTKGVVNPLVIGAQAANELLDVVDVKASFVLTELNGVVYISARAIDEINVQLIMERMGGGGHINIAGAQIEGQSAEEVKDMLKKVISDMTLEGDIG